MGTYLSPLQRISRIVVFVKNYLESGFLDLLSTGQCTADAYRPATLNYNAAVTAYLAAQDTPLQGAVTIDEGNTALTEYPFTGEIIADGAESKSVGCASKQLEITVGPPCDTTYTGGNFCDLGILVKKQAIKSVPGSLFTGKTRLFVQAVYGANRADYSHSGLTLTLDDGQGHNYTLDPMGVDGNSWLLSLIDGNYALVKKSGASLIVTPLLLTSDAQQFASILAAHPDKNVFAFSARVEAYILAYAKPDTGNEISVSITGPSVTGDPLSYGWHTNWAGDEANIVTFFADAANNRYLSNRYRITISQTLVGSVVNLTAAMVAEESLVPWVNWGTSMPLHVFFYDETTQQMMPVPLPSAAPAAPFSHDAPVYCFTRLNTAIGDCELQIVRAYRNITSIPSEASNGPVKVTELADFIEWLRKEYSGGQGQSGFKVVGPVSSSWIGPNSTMIYNNTITDLFTGMGGLDGPAGISWDNNNTWKEDDGWSFVAANRYTKSDGAGGSINARLFTQIANFSKVERYRDIEVQATAAFMEAPLNSCDSIIAGYSTETSNNGGSGRTRTGWWYWDDILYYADPTTLDPDFSQPLLSFSGSGGSLYIRSYSPGSTNFNMTLTDTGSVSAAAELLYETKIYEIIGSEDVALALSSTANGDSRYFSPSTTSPGTGTIDIAMSSIQSGAKSNHTLYSQDYGFINHASVGWA